MENRLELHQILRGEVSHRGALQYVLDFTCIAPVLTASESKRTLAENLGQILDFSSVKIRIGIRAKFLRQ